MSQVSMRGWNIIFFFVFFSSLSSNTMRTVCRRSPHHHHHHRHRRRHHPEWLPTRNTIEILYLWKLIYSHMFKKFHIIYLPTVWALPEPWATCWHTSIFIYFSFHARLTAVYVDGKIPWIYLCVSNYPAKWSIRKLYCVNYLTVAFSSTCFFFFENFQLQHISSFEVWMASLDGNVCFSVNNGINILMNWIDCKRYYRERVKEWKSRHACSSS